MKHTITANHFRICVGKQRKSEATPLSLLLIDLRRVHANAHHLDAARIELRKSLLETPQLGVAQGSPKAPIENQHRALRSRKQIGQRDRLAVLIRQRELRRLLTDVRRAG